MENGLTTAIDSALFDDYQRELESLETFRERYRHLYPFAGLERDDPDVQRLLEGLAFFTARTRRAADRALAGYERRALEQVFPHLVTPLPSMAMLTVDGTERMIEPRTLPAGTEVAVSAQGDGQARPTAAITYRTLRDLVVRPFDLDRPRIKLARMGDEGYELVIPFRSTTQRSEAVDTIELHLDPHGDLLAALRLHHALARHVEGVHCVFPGTAQAARRVHSFAFTPLPGEGDGFANPLERFRSLVHFPLAALAVRFTIDQTPASWQQLELRLRIKPAWPRELSVPPGAFVLHAVPMINLRRELADPVPLDGTKARLEVAHPEPALELRARELVAVYRSTTGGLVPLLPEALAAPDDDWYAAEVAGRHTARQLWLDVHAPGAFAARAAIIADVDWYHPGAGRLLRGRLDARLTGRHLEGARCRVIAPIEPALDSPLAGRRDRLNRLLGLAGRSDLDARSLGFLLDVLGCAEHELFQRVARAIASLAVTRQADARSPSGMRTTLDVVLARLPLALLPAAELLFARLPDLLAAWSGDEPPIVRLRIEGDEDDITTTYRSESSQHA
jgi:type VI secretion system protein ImpG